MNFSYLLKNYINERFSQESVNVPVHGVVIDQWFYLFKQFAINEPFKNFGNLLVFKDNDEAERKYEAFKDCLPKQSFYFPGLDVSPYSGHIFSELPLLERFKTLCTLVNDHNIFIFTSLEALSLKGPKLSFIKEYSFSLEVSDILSPLDLSEKLAGIGYSPSSTVEEPGTFSRKGEIFDLFPIGGAPVRISYFDDMIEEIYSFDLETQISNTNEALERITINPSPQIFSGNTFSMNLRSKIGPVSQKFPIRRDFRQSLFAKLSQGLLFENYSLYCPLFLDETTTLAEIAIENNFIITFFNLDECQQSLTEYKEIIHQDLESHYKNEDNEILLQDYGQIFSFDDLGLLQKLKSLDVKFLNIGIDFNDTTVLQVPIEQSKSFLRKSISQSSKGSLKAKDILSFLNTNQKIATSICYQTESAKQEILHLCDVLDFNIQNRIEFHKFPLDHGFYHQGSNSLTLSEADFFSRKIKTSGKRKKEQIDLFAEQISSLKKGDYIVHNDFGIGVYDGLQSLDIGGNSDDFIVIIYEGNDKVYVPVYKINLIQKYADENASVKVANLNTNKFDQAKSRAKNSAKKLAFDLVKLQAERESTPAFSFSAPDDIFRDFELKFPFEETPDQLDAIHDVLDDMQRPHPMDRLICGDVGFGKTEVAMRASLKAVLDGKQVAILVPTTVLAFQHYNSFVKRFKDFAVNIEFISRFKTAAEIKESLVRCEQGEVDILIGTHRLLSKDISFKDLGLVIIDEEQRFGVGHKEKLKLLKKQVDFLTLTATPIPRTLQLAFLGLRDLSLIQTAPPKRQSIKTYIIKEDDSTIKQAIEKEIKRGGQVFYVHNRVRDIEEVSSYIHELVPHAKVLIAHGQLPEKELEKRMNSFYSGDYNVLLSTTIIESGIDIPSANTMIVNRANAFGLSQLHQLRGRIGRSEKKAYVYFVIGKNRELSEIASKRLQALQTYNDIGSGFSIASSDLEIRGAGDILGAEQSGHMEAVGLEIYMELLKEAIDEIKGEKKTLIKDVEIQTPFSTFIPSTYIKDSSERLKTYKRLSNAKDEASLKEMKDELINRFGPSGSELTNLFDLFAARLYFRKCGIQKVKVAGKTITMNFSQEFLEDNKNLREQIVHAFLSQQQTYKFSPDFSVRRTYKDAITMQKIVQLGQHIAEQIFPC